MSDNYPLFPELTEEAQKEAVNLIESFKSKIKKAVKEATEEVYNTFYCDIMPYIESNQWTNFRNELMDGFRDYNNRKIQGKYDFKEIRQTIYKEFKDEIDKDLNQDMLKEIESLKRINESLRRY